MRNTIVAASLLFLFASPALADRGECGQPISPGHRPTIFDVLYLLHATTHDRPCDAAVCDVNSDCRVTVADAFRLFHALIKHDYELVCHDGCDEVLLCRDDDVPMCGGYCPEGYGCTEVEKPNKKRRICHKGLVNPRRAKTIEVGRRAQRKHLAHGDYRGRCMDDGRDRSMTEASDSDSDWKPEPAPQPEEVRSECRCRPVPPVTTTLPGATTTTTHPDPTTTTTMPDASTDFDNDGMNDAADPCATDPRNLCYGPVAMDRATDLPIRINANSDLGDACSGARTDCSGAMWVDDFAYSMPSVSDVCSLPEGCPLEGVDAAFGCSDAATEDLMRCERFANVLSGQPPLSYAFAVEDGDYLVNLYFANTFSGTAAAGSRVFDIEIEGEVVYASFDQVMAAGGSGTVVIRSAVVNVADGMLDIEFMAIVENPAVKAIEVLSAP